MQKKLFTVLLISSTLFFTFSIHSFANTIGSGTITTPVVQDSDDMTDIISDTLLDTRDSVDTTAVTVTNGTLDIAGSNIDVFTSGTGFGFNIDSTNNAAFFKNEAGSSLSITTIGSTYAYGLWAAGSSKVAGTPVVSMANTTIKTAGDGSSGVVLANGADGVFNNISIETSGAKDPGNNSAGAYGLNTQINGSAIISNSTILTHNANATSLLNTTNSRLIADHMILTTEGQAAFGLNSQDGSNSEITHSIISTSGLYGYGLRAGSGASYNISTLTANNMIIETTGVSAVGITAMGRGTINLANSSILTSGNSAYGLYTVNDDSQITMTNTNITTTGITAHAADATQHGLITLNNSNLTTQGNQAIGVLVNAEEDNPLLTQTFLNNSSVLTQGNQSHGLEILEGGSLTSSHSSIETQGILSADLLIISHNGYTANAYINSGIFTSLNGPAIGVADGIANITLNNTIVTGSTYWLLVGASAGVSAVQNIVVTSSDSKGSAAFASANKSSINPPLLAALSTATITTFHSILNGGTLTESGNIANVNLQHSQWNMRQSSNLTNLTNSSSFINFAGFDSSFKTLTVNNYIGENGHLLLNTFLGDDTSPTDQLIIDGGSATGSSSITISNTTGEGALTTGNGILVVNTLNGGTTNPTAFQLSAPITVGPYEYLLFRGALDGSNDENWYLRDINHLPSGNDIPIYSREVSLAAAIPSTALLYDQFILGTLHQRVGEQEQINARTPSRTLTNGMWIKGVQQSGSFNNNGIYFNGPSFNYNFTALQVGLDLYHSINLKQGSNYAGILGFYGKSHGNVDHLNGINAGKNNFDAWTLGGYFTHYDTRGWYIDNVISATLHQINANSQRGLTPILTKGYGFIGSVEGGYNIPLTHGFSIEPETQIILERLTFNNPHNSFAITFDATHSLVGRVGARLTRTWSISHVSSNVLTGWLFGNIWNQFQGHSRTHFAALNNDIPFSSDVGSTTSQLGLGVTALISHGVSLYGAGNYMSNWGQHGHSLGAELGVRFNC